MRPKQRIVLPLLGLFALSAPVVAASDAHAGGVQLFVQTPYDFQQGTFDLDNLERQNIAPVFQQSFTIPYDTIEALGRAKVAERIRARLGGVAKCGDGILDPFCPDATWNAVLGADFQFTRRGEPVFTAFGNPQDNGVRVTVDAQVKVELTARVHVATSITDADIFVPMTALIGVHASVAVNLFPVLRAQDLDIAVAWDGGDVEIHGLDGHALAGGAILGTALGLSPIGSVVGGPVIGAAFGAVTGKVTLDAAKAEAKAKLLEKAKAAIESAGALLTTAVGDAMQPKIAQANDLLGGILNKPLPVVQKTYGELQALLGMSIDVRSATSNNMFRSAVTTRFLNTPGGGRVSGTFLMPKTACRYVQVDSPLQGSYTIAESVIAVNSDIVGKSCAEVAASGVASLGYYGASPDQALRTGEARNQLASWSALGTTAFSGVVTESPEGYQCSYSVTGLPNASILELHPQGDRVLDQRRYGMRKGGCGSETDASGRSADARFRRNESELHRGVPAV